MPAPTEAQFRADYPEFAAPQAYPPSAVTFWLNVSGAVLTARWDDTLNAPITMLYLGTELFVAHNLILGKEAAQGGGVGAGLGVVQSKSVGPISVAYNTTLAIEPGAGHWNLTTYGLRFNQLMQMMGAGPIFVGAGTHYLPFMVPVPMGSPWFGPTVDLGWGTD